MPNTKSAKKALRQIKKRTRRNKMWKLQIKQAIRAIKKSKTEKERRKLIDAAQSVIDRAARRNVIHKNKAARLKSKISTGGKK